ncbi:MAG: hypothetical protein ACXQTE_03175, partial [Methanosarcinaceae archaeon]
MRTRQVHGILIALLMLIGSLSIVPMAMGNDEGQNTSTDATDGTESARWGQPTEFLTTHSTSENYFDSLFTFFETDIDHDGYQDLLILGTDHNGSAAMAILELNNGTTLAYEAFTNTVSNFDLFMDINGDGYLDPLFILDDGAGQQKLEIFSTSTLSWVFDSGWFAGTLDYDVIGSSLVIYYSASEAGLPVRVFLYDNSTFANTWTSPIRYPHASISSQDLNGDGVREIIISSTFSISVAPGNEAHLYVIDETTPSVVLNTTDYCASWCMKLNILDMDGDGFSELIMVINYNWNSTARVVVYTAKTWTSIWSTADFQSISKTLYGDVNADGVTDLILMTDNGVKLMRVIYGTQATLGATAMYQYYQIWGTIYVRDMDGDSIDDIFLLNNSGSHDQRCYRLYKGGVSGPAMQYNISTLLSDKYDEDLTDITGDTTPEFYEIIHDSSGPTTFYQFRFYNLTTFSLIFQTAKFDRGSGGMGGVDWEWTEATTFVSIAPPPGPNDYHALLIVNWHYDDVVDTNDFYQVYVYDCSIGGLVHRSARVYGTGTLSLTCHILDMDRDGFKDIYYDSQWADTMEPRLHTNVTFVMSNPWRTAYVLDAMYHDGMNSVSTSDFDLNGTQNCMAFHMRVWYNAFIQYNDTIFNTSTTPFTVLYKINSTNRVEFQTPDVTGDGHPDLAVIQYTPGPAMLTFVDMRTGGPTTLKAFNLPHYSSIYMFTQESLNDSKAILVIRGETGSTYDMRIYDTSDWSIITSLSASYISMSARNLNLDRSVDLLCCENNYLDPLQGRMSIFDLETGERLWTSGMVVENFFAFYDDLDGDGDWEIVCFNFFDTSSGEEVFNVQVSDILVNHVPQASAVPDVNMDEDTVHTLDLDDHVTDDG